MLLAVPVLLAGCDMQSRVLKEQSFVVEFIGWLFEDVLKYIFFTPFEFFVAPTATGILMKMGLVSGGVVTALTMVEGFKRMLSLSYTPMKQVFGRYPIALAASAFAPFFFYYMGMGANWTVQFMGVITGSSLDGVNHFTNTLHGLTHHIYEAFISFILMIALLFYIVKVILFHAVRWFGLLFNMVMTPVAMTAFMFKPYESIASGWFKDTIGKFMVATAHSFLLSLIAVMLYAPIPSFVDSGEEMFADAIVRLLFAIGGLHMMNHPPSWIRRWFDSGSDIRQYGSTFKRLGRATMMMNYKFKPKG